MMNELETIVLIALSAHEQIHQASLTNETQLAFELELRRRLMKKYCANPNQSIFTTSGGAVPKFSILHG
jgi:hypothetical protein